MPVKDSIAKVFGAFGFNAAQGTALAAAVVAALGGWYMLYSKQGQIVERTATLEGKAIIYDAIAPAIEQIGSLDDDITELRVDMGRVLVIIEGADLDRLLQGSGG